MQNNNILQPNREPSADNGTKPNVSSRSVRAIKKCADWLKYCLDIGYHKDDLDTLEKIWWQHHDWNTGEVS